MRLELHLILKLYNYQSSQIAPTHHHPKWVLALIFRFHNSWAHRIPIKSRGQPILVIFIFIFQFSISKFLSFHVVVFFTRANGSLKQIQSKFLNWPVIFFFFIKYSNYRNRPKIIYEWCKRMNKIKRKR